MKKNKDSKCPFSDDEIDRKIAAEICKARRCHGITQQEFYDNTGIHIGRIESMGRSIKMTTLLRVCYHLKIPCHTIVERLDL